MNAWANAAGYQCVWFACVWAASRGHGWVGPLALLPFSAWVIGRVDGGADALLLPAAVLVGLVLDTLLAASGLVAYAAPLPFAQVAPLWILAIWGAFGLTLRHSFRFLHGRRGLAAALGAVGAPMAYLGAARGWHAVAFPHGATPAAIALGAAWAVVLPGLIGLAGRVERTSAPPPSRTTIHVG